MNFLLLAYGFSLGLAVLILILNLILALNDFEKELNYSIVAVGLCILIYFAGHLTIYFAENVQEVIGGAKILNSATLAASAFFALFSYYYAKSVKRSYIVVLSVLAIILLIINIVKPYGMRFDEVNLNFQFEGYWAREVKEIPGKQGIWQDILYTYPVIFLLFVIYVTKQIFKEKRYSEAIQYGSSILIIVLAVLIDGYVYNFHEELAFIAMLILMSFRLFSKLIDSFKFEQALKRSEEKYRRIFENSAFGIYSSTLDGRLLMINPAGMDILGITSNDDYSKPNFLNQFYKNPEEREQFKNILLQNDNIYNYERELVKKNGKKVLVKQYVYLVKDITGTSIIEGAFVDISEKKRFENLLIKAKEEAEKSNNLKSEFLAQMSHEIRTPVNTILNYTGLLKADWEDNYFDDTPEYFGTIATASKRITRTIDLILNMSQIQTDTYEANYSFVNFNDILDRLVKEFKLDAEEKGLKIQMVNAYSNTVVWGDEYTITQIFANLIDNAIKYTEEGEINIYIESENNILRVIVKDTGIGISEEFQKNLFAPFSQEQQGYTRRFDGNGLGLALVNKYCVLNNASIDFESQVGKGSKFIVTFIL